MGLGILAGTVIAICVVVAAALIGVAYLSSRRGRPAPPLPFYAGSVALLFVIAALAARSELVESLPQMVRSGLDVAAWLGASFFLFTILDHLIIGEWLIDRGQRYIPDIVRHLLIGAEVVAAGVLILWLVMGINLVALVALPTVAAAMVGVALKDTLTRFFSGIELGKIVKIGDWITVLDREGIVTHIGMEHVTLLTRTQDLVSLPNDLVIQSGVTNFTRPTTTHLCSVYVEAAYRTAPDQVCATLIEAASSVPGVATDPKPVAMVTAFNESGIQYRIKFPILDYGRYPIIESLVRTYIWHAFVRKGIEIPFPQRVVHNIVDGDTAPKEQSIARIIAQLTAVDFLAMLDTKQIEVLAREARWESYLIGERVVRQGEPGAVLYVIVSGQADVRLEQGGLSSTVTTLSSGQFFGEMSLLTGEPRSATVVAATELSVVAVGKDALMRIVEDDRRLLERIGEVVARRQAATAAAKAQLSRDAAALSAVTHTRSLIERIQSFFWGDRKPMPSN
ncbi:MAG: mechanosensitive ion channel family protein [Nitrospira sp.]|jgi:small-conductance mechanosensitive channel/CRP-like cAMP-binding protein|nr:MAG: mechanosensitive ion channel family protein [Nitrospira sp.]